MNPTMYLDLAREDRRERLAAASGTRLRRWLRRPVDARWHPPDALAHLRGGRLVTAI